VIQPFSLQGVDIVPGSIFIIIFFKLFSEISRIGWSTSYSILDAFSLGNPFFGNKLGGHFFGWTLPLLPKIKCARRCRCCFQIGKKGCYGQLVFSNTFNKMGQPLTTCQPNSPIPAALAPIWIERAVSFPFCMAGTQEAASAQRQTNPAPA
jgi:hypothetical protein